MPAATVGPVIVTATLSKEWSNDISGSATEVLIQLVGVEPLLVHVGASKPVDAFPGGVRLDQYSREFSMTIEAGDNVYVRPFYDAAQYMLVTR